MDVEFMLYDSLEVGFALHGTPDLSDTALRLSVQSWWCSRPSRRRPPPSMRCLPPHFRLLVVRGLVCLSIEFAPDCMRLVVTGDDSGDESGDEGPGREREDEEEAEETGSPVGQLLKIPPPPANIHLY